MSIASSQSDDKNIQIGIIDIYQSFKKCISPLSIISYLPFLFGLTRRCLFTIAMTCNRLHTRHWLLQILETFCHDASWRQLKEERLIFLENSFPPSPHWKVLENFVHAWLKIFISPHTCCLAVCVAAPNSSNILSVAVKVLKAIKRGETVRLTSRIFSPPHPISATYYLVLVWWWRCVHLIRHTFFPLK